MGDGVIDPDALRELRQTTDDAFAVELIDTYLEDSPQLLESMRAALAEGDAEQLRRAAHSLKSNSATVGAAKLSAMAKELEGKGRDGQLDGAEHDVAEIETMFARVRDALEQTKHDLQA